ncbi:DUF4260 domain-containing protein [Devosia faecipullorum]|uniref:DUF4260 domain-containing protein n=1 Tax=Devosia faecipullorum TaxID=2755039 RepID=UPI00187BB994|nr:DUF4260 domain-containing protein [Devosia faecipullorum]MBE7733925.1 DUF4260 domain-containing protein [Devosia faecipullorum]
MQNNIETGAVGGHVRTILRLEGLAVLAVATTLYFLSGGIWWVYLLLLFVPDLSFIGYAAGNRTGAIIYNLCHSYIVPLLIGLAGHLLGSDLVVQIALIHLAHIGFDRMLGYGLKYASGFTRTHLGTLRGGKS